jgi:hypothetical protein
MPAARAGLLSDCSRASNARKARPRWRRWQAPIPTIAESLRSGQCIPGRVMNGTRMGKWQDGHDEAPLEARDHKTGAIFAKLVEIQRLEPVS